MTTELPPELAGEIFLVRVRQAFAALAESTPALNKRQRQELCELFTDAEVLIMHESVQ